MLWAICNTPRHQPHGDILSKIISSSFAALVSCEITDPSWRALLLQYEGHLIITKAWSNDHPEGKNFNGVDGAYIRTRGSAPHALPHSLQARPPRAAQAVSMAGTTPASLSS
ncbi:hypothetical protein MPH_02051 [Macrophomina phaseolina MS6]|uniref:Uncharacterized protein n=1 Tax=Macrophomina phaseolina (strain MS6) TaxID=1126212 RepID=K2SDR9_MACPH|nr:hypothetical protein MPH_02051 [Macrophomina phaseolina MS6]